MNRVSVVIVSYNTKRQLCRCLDCLKDVSEIIVVDNASSDRSAELVRFDYPHVKLIENSVNVGFGAANNQGIDIASEELILLINSDAYAEPGAIQKLSAIFSDASVIAAGGKLLNPDRSLQNSSSNNLTLWAVVCEQLYLEKFLPRSKLFSPYWNSSAAKEEPLQTEQVMGACLMMRRGAARFDERFFLYCEDTELCFRLRKLGKILYVPQAEFIHELGSSSHSDRWRSVAFYNRGKERFFEIHFGKRHAKICLFLNRLGALVRFLIWTLVALLTLNKNLAYIERAKLFWKVLSCPFEGPEDPRQGRSSGGNPNAS